VGYPEPLFSPSRPLLTLTWPVYRRPKEGAQAPMEDLSENGLATRRGRGNRAVVGNRPVDG